MRYGQSRCSSQDELALQSEATRRELIATPKSVTFTTCNVEKYVIRAVQTTGKGENSMGRKSIKSALAHHHESQASPTSIVFNSFPL